MLVVLQTVAVRTSDISPGAAIVYALVPVIVEF